MSSGWPFFWDNVLLSSKFAHHYYENGFSQLILPTEYDCGHPPFYGMYLASWWKVFGQTLAVSHWAAFPFLVGIAFFYLKIANYFLPESWLPVSALFLFLEPTLLTQAVMSGTELPLVMGFLMITYGILKDHRKWLWIPMLIVCSVSIRGILWVILLFLFDLVHGWFFRQRKIIAVKWILPYIPAGIFVIIWYAFHYQQTGWLMVNPDSSWGGDYRYIYELPYVFKRVLFFCWHIADFGRIFIWAIGILSFIFITYKNYFKSINKKVKEAKLFEMFCLYALPLALFVLPLLPRTSTLMHRYFIFSYLMFGIRVLMLLVRLKSKYWSIFGIIVITIGLMPGHLWRHPDRFGMGWDATLGHVPYYQLRHQMVDFMDQNKINKTQVATAFPLDDVVKYPYLNDETWAFAVVNQKQLESHLYILQSNIINKFSVQTQTILKQDWILVKEYEQYPVYMRLYKNPKL